MHPTPPSSTAPCRSRPARAGVLATWPPRGLALTALIGLSACVDPGRRPLELPLQLGATSVPRAEDGTVTLPLGPWWEARLTRAELRLTAATLRAPAETPRWGDTPPLGTPDPVPDPYQGQVVGTWVGVRWVDLLSGDGDTLDAQTGAPRHTVGTMTAWEGPLGTLDLDLVGQPGLYLEGALVPVGVFGVGPDGSGRAVPLDLSLAVDQALTGVGLPQGTRLTATVPPDADGLRDGLAVGERTGEASPLVVQLDLAALLSGLPRPRQPLPIDPQEDRGQPRPRPLTDDTEGVGAAVAVGLGSAGAWQAHLAPTAIPDPLAPLLPDALDDLVPPPPAPGDTAVPPGGTP